MATWKKFLLIGAGFGAGLAILAAALIGGWAWYASRPEPPKPWNAKAIVATFDFPEIEAGQPGQNGLTPDYMVFYYTIENTSDLDYQIPSRDQFQLGLRLKNENSLTANDDQLTLGAKPIFVPAKQRMHVGVHMEYRLTRNFGPTDTLEQRRARRRAVAEYMKTEASNIDGFVLLDTTNRYRIEFPAGWVDFK